jgi:hypothetical protein
MNNMKQYSLLGLGVALLGSYLLTAAPVQTQASDFGSTGTHLTKFKKVEVTESSAALLSEDGKKLFGTGKGFLNGVSVNDLTETTLINIPLSANETIVDIDAGIGNVLIATSEGDVYTYGNGQAPYNTSGSATPIDITTSVNPTKKAINYVRQGTDVAFIIFQDATIVGWGSNSLGQLGNNTAADGNIRNVTTIPTAFKSTNTIVDWDVRFRSGYALLSNGRVWTWGVNTNGQLGLGNTNNTILPTLVSAFTGVYSVSVGLNHGIALTGTGNNFAVWGFGNNTKRQLSNHIAANATNHPTNLTTYFTSTGIPENDGDVYDDYSILGDSANGQTGDDDYTTPKSVLASIQTTYLIVQRNYVGEVTWNDILGFGSNESGEIQYWDTETPIMGYPEYLDTDYYYEDHFVLSFANNGSFSGTVNTEGDYLLQGINTNNRLGSSDAEENYVVNYSDEVRYFVEDIYAELPTSFQAPLDDEYLALTVDQIGAIFGYWPNDFYFQPGIVSYYFDDSFEYLTERERAIISETQWGRMQEIFAEVFENEIVYGWLATDALLQEELENTDPEYRYSYRYDLEFYTEYGSYELSDYLDDYIYLDDAIIDILDPTVETRLDEFREIIANVNEFEQDHLQTLLDAIKVYDATSEFDYFYTDEDDQEDYEWLELYDLSVGELIEAGLGDDILAVFAAYEALSEIEQMLLTEYYYWNYDELYYGYYEYFITVYENALDEIATIDENNYFELFDMLAEIEALLADIDDLNEISFDLFTSFDEEDELYEYELYEYWIYLSELLPYLQEAKPVFDDWQAIESALDYDEFEDIELDRESALAILAMYEDYSDLSEDAQYTLDDERINYLYELALSFLVDEVEDALYNVWDIEDESGYDGLLENLDDVNAALALYDNLPEDLLEFMDSDAVDYYEYLKDLQAALTEALPVYNMIQALPEVPSEDDIESILEAVEAYQDLSDEAKELLDTSLLNLLLENVAEQLIDALPLVEELTLDDESDVELARRAYNLLTEDQQEALGEDYLLSLEAAEARIEALKQTAWGDILTTFGVLLLHLAAAAYFVFLKRKDLAKLTGLQILAK